MTEHAPTDSALLELVRDAFPEESVARVTRRSYRYATSAPLEELRVSIADRTDVSLIFKDLAWERRLDGARRSKPSFLYEPRREIEIHRSILAREHIGPRCYAAIADATQARFWLLLEKAPGVELWQIGELTIWEAVARWLATLHGRFANRVAEVRAANPFLLDWNTSWLRMWSRRAQAALRGSDDRRSTELLGVLERYDDTIDAVLTLPVTLVHGEFYPSNIVVVGQGPELRVCPLDWEMAATGPGLVDLAALVEGWGELERERLVAAYGSALPSDDGRAAQATLLEQVDRCRLALSVQWLGWSAGWDAPPEHAHDWIGEALDVAERLPS